MTNTTFLESAKVLIVDDEKTTRLALSEAFTLNGSQVQSAASADEALELFKQTSFDAVLLDLNMPGKHGGIDILKAAENVAPNTAFIILTGQPSTETAITALRSGAYDYLRKPVTLNTILETTEAALRKQAESRRQKNAVSLLQQAMGVLQLDSAPTTPESPYLEIGSIKINNQKYKAFHKGEELDLTPIEYKLLRKFVENPDTIMSYAELAQATHNSTLDEVEARTLLRTHIYRLSRKLGDKENTPLQNVRGQGVILLEEMTL